MSGALERLRSLLLEQGGLMASLIADGSTAEPVSPAPHSPPSGPAQPPDDSAPAGSPDDSEPGSSFGDSEPLPSPGSEPARIAAAGPRTGARAAEYELLVEAVYEGYLLHYGAPRLLHPREADLGLLAGDQLYALGLARLVALGDLAAVAELADVITLTALAQGAGREELAQAIWAAGARAVGWGSNEPHNRAKALARAGDPKALEAMSTAAEGH